jgi:selenocysteine lyase/cysteine desulfurase
LNIAIKSLAGRDARVLVSGLEHNAVMRPLHALRSRNVEYTVVPTELFDPAATLQNFWSAINDSTSLVVCTHVSNVFGAVMPVAELAKLCHNKGVPLVIDASQSAGVIPINMKELPGATLCMPGHKALYGPQGTGLLILSKSGKKFVPLMEGGTGSNSMQFDMPDELPDTLEAGTLNAWGAIGLIEGINFVRGKTPQKIDALERRLTRELVAMIGGNTHIKCFSHPEHQTGVLSMTFDDYDVETVAEQLSDAGIAVRAGLQCAPMAHMTAGTMPWGTLRVSLSAFSTPGDIKTFARKINQIVR